MTNGIEHGIKRAIEELLITSVIFFTVLKLLDTTEKMLSNMSYYFVIIKIILISLTTIGSFHLFSKEKYWSTGYLVGWIIGIFLIIMMIRLLLELGIYEPSDILFIVIYLISSIIILIKRISYLF